jgi:hypothetical protein
VHARLRDTLDLDSEIDVLGIEADSAAGGCDLQVDVRVLGVEAAKTRHQPLDRHCGKQLDTERTRPIGAQQAARCFVNAIEGDADRLRSR